MAKRIKTNEAYLIIIVGIVAVIGIFLMILNLHLIMILVQIWLMAQLL